MRIAKVEFLAAYPITFKSLQRAPSAARRRFLLRESLRSDILVTRYTCEHANHFLRHYCIRKLHS